MTRVIRANSQNVSPSDDASLYRTIYDDGLFEDVSIVSAGAALVTIPAMYGILEGRDFTTDEMQISVELPTSGTGTGSIVVKFDTTTDDVISVVSGLNYSLTYEDINDTGTICEMEIATYTASATAVTAITSTYNIINPHTLTECGDTIGTATLTTTAQTLTGAVNELDSAISNANQVTTISGNNYIIAYAKFGRLVFASGDFTYNGTLDTVISDLPTPRNATSFVARSTSTGKKVGISLLVNSSGTTLTFYLQLGDAPVSGQTYQFNFAYIASTI